MFVVLDDTFIDSYIEIVINQVIRTLYNSNSIVTSAPVQQPGADQINTSRRSLRSNFISIFYAMSINIFCCSGLPPLFSIEEFTARRRGKRPEDSKLPRRIQ